MSEEHDPHATKSLADTTRLWSLPFLHSARGYLLAHLRMAGRGAERDELERMQQAIYFAIHNWKD
jgi:hypothetical protein